MRGKSSLFRKTGPPKSGFAAAGFERFPNRVDNENTLDEVIGEVGLVLVVFLGIVVAVNLELVALHLS